MCSSDLGDGETLSAGYLLAARRDAAWAVKTALMAGTRLFNAAGGRAIYESNALQRQYRNLIAASAHSSVAWDENAIAAGRELIAAAAP